MNLLRLYLRYEQAVLLDALLTALWFVASIALHSNASTSWFADEYLTWVLCSFWLASRWCRRATMYWPAAREIDDWLPILNHRLARIIWRGALLCLSALFAAYPVLFSLSFLYDPSAFDLDGLAFLVFLAGVLSLELVVGWVISLRALLASKETPYKLSPPMLLSLPAVSILTLALIVADVPFRTRLSLSAGPLTRFAVAVPEGHHQRYEGHGRHVGLFWVREAEKVDGCARFITTRVFLDDAGIVRCDQKPRPVGEDSFDHVTGPWWRWYRSW